MLRLLRVSTFALGRMLVAAFVVVSLVANPSRGVAMPATQSVEWTLTFEHEVSVEGATGAGETYLAITNLKQVQGSAVLHEATDGSVSGAGLFSVSEHNQMKGLTPGDQAGTGQGTFTVTGKRDVNRLLLSFAGPVVSYRLQGTINLGWGPTEWNDDSSFEVSSIAIEGQAIERRDGAKARYTVDSATAGPRATMTTDFVLSGAAGVEPTPTAAPTSAAANPWTLTYRMNFSSEIDVPGFGTMGSSYTCRGESAFAMPLQEGPVTGRAGSYECRVSLAGVGLWAIEAGTMTFQGEVQEDLSMPSGRRLTFEPKLTVESVNVINQALGGSRPGLDIGTFVGGNPTENIDVGDGTRVMVDIPALVGTGGGQVVWQLSGRSVEHWAVDLSGSETWTRPFEVTMSEGQKVFWNAGIDVPWMVQTRLEIDDEGCTAAADVVTGPVTVVSNPPGIYSVTYSVQPPMPRTIECAKRNRAVLLTYPTGWGHTWQYTYSVSDEAGDLLADPVLMGGADFVERQRTLPEEQRSEMGQSMVPDERLYDIALRDASYVGAQGEAIEVYRID